jgi:hypothetical protein
LCRLTKATGRTTKYGHDTIKRAGSDTERGKQGKKKKKKKKGKHFRNIFFRKERDVPAGTADLNGVLWRPNPP